MTRTGNVRPRARPHQGPDELAQAQSLLRRRRLDEAGKILEQALRSRPRDEGLLAESGIVAYFQGRLGDALAIFDDILRSNPAHEVALKWRIASLRGLGPGRSVEAEAAIGEALGRLPDNPAILTERGWLRYDQGRVDDAIADFHHALKARDDEQAMQGLAAAWRRHGKFAEADALLQKAVALFPDGLGLLNEAGWSRLAREQFDEAFAAFRKALDVVPDDEGALLGGISALRQRRRFGEAEDLIAQALGHHPESVGVWNERGWLAFDRKQFDEANAAFNRSLELAPKDTGAHTGKIAALRVSRRFEETARAIDEALNLLGAGPDVLHWKGLLLFDRRRYEEALVAFEQVLGYEPDHEGALQGRIAARRLQRQFDTAELLIREAEKLRPESTAVLSELAWLHFEKGELAEAEQTFARAIALRPGNILMRISRAEILQRMRLHNQAHQILLELDQAYPGDPEITEHLGRFYLRRNDPAGAEKQFQALLQLQPTSPAALTGLGGVALKRGRYGDALETFRKVLKADPRVPIYHVNLAWALLREGMGESWVDSSEPLTADDDGPVSSPARAVVAKLDEAAEHCRTAMALEPNRAELAEALACLGAIAMNRGSVADVEYYLDESIRTNPNQGNLVSLATFYVRSERLEEAAAKLKEAIEINPDAAEAHQATGELALRKGPPKAAVPSFQRAAALDPTNEDAHRGLALALMDDNRLDEARRVLRKAIRLVEAPRRWRLHLIHCQLLTRLGDTREDRNFYEEALEEATKAARLRPEHPAPFLHSGIVRYKLDDYKTARADFRRCLKKDPDQLLAELHRRTAQKMIDREQKISLAATYGGIGLAVFALGLVSTLWYAYFASTRVSDSVLLAMTPLLLGIAVLSLLLPGLIRVKLPGLEADLNQPKPQESVAAGPKGEVGFQSPLATPGR
jgi:tetratricopeptide (TPR) repeat protein